MAAAQQENQEGVELFFMVAFRTGDTASALGLIAQGATLNHVNSESMTTLICAAAEGETEIVRAMLATGRDVALNARDDHGWTALTTAAHRGNAETVALLLKAGADPSVKDDMSHDALYYAKGSGDGEKIEMIETALRDHSIGQGATVAARPVKLLRTLQLKR